MKNFLFEQYGYYPKVLENNVFHIDGWMFKLFETDLNEDVINSLDEYTKVLNNAFYNKGPFIIKNKIGNNLSNLNDKYYVLISSFLCQMSLEDLLRFHFLFYKEDEYVELNKILLVWKERVDEVEKKLSTHLRADSIYYKENLDISMFCIGLSINAMQYLSESIYNYGNKLYGVTIVHKRLSDLNSFDFFNPFNFIVEHPLKDIILLYQKDYIDFEEFKLLVSNYSINDLSASFCIARLLYRGDIFDLLQSKRELEEEQRMYFNMRKEINKIKKAYMFFKNTYAIHPIDWLEESLL